MFTGIHTVLQRYGPAALCRMDPHLVAAIEGGRERSAVLAASCATVLGGTILYGAAFGIWLSPRQALYAAVKMPLMIFAVVAASMAINTMLAQVLGLNLSARRVCETLLLSIAIASALLGALTPAVLFLVSQCPSPASESALLACRGLLLLHIAVVGMCGVIGNLRLHQLLVALTGSRRLARRALVAWILVCGLVGCQFSWLLSPFLGRPDVPVPFWNPNALKSNFFEYLWDAATEIFAQAGAWLAAQPLPDIPGGIPS